MSSYGPNAHLTAPMWNWGVIYKYVAEQVYRGTWTSEEIWWGLEKNAVGLASMHHVPQAVQDLVHLRTAEIQAGTFAVFQGPILDQAGTERIPAGRTTTDAELLTMDYFVQGVVGEE